MEQASIDKITKVLNDYWNSLGYSYTRRNDYRYYRPSSPKNNSRVKDKYFYTVGRKYHKGYERFLSGVYRYNATTKTWKAMKVVSHVKKKDAINRANKLAKENK